MLRWDKSGKCLFLKNNLCGVMRRGRRQCSTWPYWKRIIEDKDDNEITLFKDLRNEVKVEADTLQAILSPMRAVLTQKEDKPFTTKDLELREKNFKNA
jgi:hypothetical protein